MLLFVTEICSHNIHFSMQMSVFFLIHTYTKLMKKPNLWLWVKLVHLPNHIKLHITSVIKQKAWVQMKC